MRRQSEYWLLLRARAECCPVAWTTCYLARAVLRVAWRAYGQRHAFQRCVVWCAQPHSVRQHTRRNRACWHATAHAPHDRRRPHSQPHTPSGPSFPSTHASIFDAVALAPFFDVRAHRPTTPAYSCPCCLKRASASHNKSLRPSVRQVDLLAHDGHRLVRLVVFAHLRHGTHRGDHRLELG